MEKLSGATSNNQRAKLLSKLHQEKRAHDRSLTQSSEPSLSGLGIPDQAQPDLTSADPSLGKTKETYEIYVQNSVKQNEVRLREAQLRVRLAATKQSAAPAHRSTETVGEDDDIIEGSREATLRELLMQRRGQ